MKRYNLGLSVIGFVITLSVFQQVYAGKPISVVCGNGKIVEMNKAQNSPAMQTRLCSKAGHPAPLKNSTTRRAADTGVLSRKGASNESQSLLLPAVQASSVLSTGQSSRQPTQNTNARKNNLGSRSSRHTADTTCSGVNSCNDMIATCIALGGNISQTSYDRDSGAPDGATCFSPGQ